MAPAGRSRPTSPGRRRRAALADPVLAAIRDAAAQRGLPLRPVSSGELVRTTGASVQHVGAVVAPLEPESVRGLLERARAAGRSPALVAVDGIEDPQNLG